MGTSTLGPKIFGVGGMFKAEVGIFFLIHLFARDDLAMKKLEIKTLYTCYFEASEDITIKLKSQAVLLFIIKERYK